MEPKMLLTEAADALGVTAQALHSQIKRKNLAIGKSKNRVYFSHQTSKQLMNLAFNPQIISFQIVKGGTGKTSLCFALGVRACLYGAKTLLIDLDQQGNLTKACRVSPHDTPIMIEIVNRHLPIEDGIIKVIDGLDIIPSRIENALMDGDLMVKRLPLDRVYKDRIQPLKSKYDLILIDCPPALGTSVTAVTLTSDRVIAPVTPSDFSLEGLEITAREIKNIERNFKASIILNPILNEFDTRTSLSHETLRFLITHDEYGKNALRTAIRKNQDFENVLAKGITIFDSLLPSPAKEDIDLLAREILKIGEFSIVESKSIDAKENRLNVSA